MVFLTTRQCNLLRYLLNIGSPAVIADIGTEMGLTARQVGYNLKTVKQWLAQYKIPLKTLPGIGVMVECSVAERTDLLKKLDMQSSFRVVLTASQRRQLMVINLLKEDIPVNLSVLQDELEVSRTTILSDLEPAAVWLAQFELTLIRRQNYGIAIEGTELSKRQALTALLWGHEALGDPLITISHKKGLIFSLANAGGALPAIERVVQLLNQWDIRTALEWVACAEAELGGRFTDDTVLYLSLGLAVQGQRVRANQRLHCAAETVQWLQNRPVWPVATKLGSRMWPLKQPETMIDEYAAIAMQLLAGARSDIWPTDQDVSAPFDHLISTFMRETARAFNAPELDKDTALRDGLVAHILPACLRNRFGLWGPPSLPDNALPEGYEATQTIVRALAKETELQVGIAIPESEINNLTLLVRAALIRERPNREVRVIVICPSGMATAQLLVARLKARFSHLKILNVLSVRELTPDKIHLAQLIISTIPLDAYNLGVQVVQVHPLLLPEDIDAITRWLS